MLAILIGIFFNEILMESYRRLSLVVSSGNVELFSTSRKRPSRAERLSALDCGGDSGKLVCPISPMR